jgi:DNA-binding response OmpR family regulator
MKILIIEDNPHVSTLLVFYLTHNAHQVTLIEKIKGGYELAEKFGPDLILADYELPDGTSVQLLSDFSRMLPQAGCVVMSGSDQTYLENQLTNLKFSFLRFLPKPFTTSDLQQMLNEYLTLAATY